VLSVGHGCLSVVNTVCCQMGHGCLSVVNTVCCQMGHGCLSVVNTVCCQIQFSASGRSLVQRNPTECGVSVCDLETS
jgi:hypothetical protein